MYHVKAYAGVGAGWRVTIFIYWFYRGLSAYQLQHFGIYCPETPAKVWSVSRGASRIVMILPTLRLVDIFD